MKRALFVFSVLLSAFIISASTLTTRYYLTELDFISNQPVPESKTRFTTHITAEFDEQNKLIKKLNIDRRGELTQTEIYLYDTLGVLTSKDMHIPEDNLVQQMLFGMESKAVDYIEYVYGVDTVKDWTDRFSILDYNDLEQLTNHAFFDVNAFQYGNARFEYDSLGYLSKEEWIRQPSVKIMHWWDHYFDPVTNLTRIMEFDSNGVLLQDFRLSPDDTESIFWFSNLEDSMYVNHTDLNFKNESYLKWGKVIWYKVDTSGAYSDSVEFNLSRRLLKKGKFGTNMGLDSVLVDSAMYDLVFKGRGKSGYDATQRKVLGITYDISPPLMDLFAKQFINEPKISFDQSEPLTAARVEWHAIHDSSSIISVEFDSSDLSKSGEGLFKPVHQEDLQDSVFYRIQIYGTDYAGNVSLPTVNDSIMFDIRPPEVELISPLHSEFRNFTTIDWIINEPIQSWKIEVISIAGKPDYNAPHSYQSDSLLFTDVEMFKELADEFQLNDGSIYRFELSAIDRTGNTSAVFEVDSVTYDITPPLLTTIYPANGALINATTVSYSINEPLRAGEFRWEQTEGTMDSSAPHIIPLIGEELDNGDHIQVELSNQTELTDGSMYTLLFVGMDRAGNVGKLLPNTEILFDAVPPEFTDILPLTGSALNHQYVSYTLSEKVNTGSITWSWIGGVKDNAAPHKSKFLSTEDEGGVHDSLLLTMNPQLVDGGIYNLEFNAADRAGNIAETFYVENVLYDFTNPVMSLSYPTAMSFLPKKNFTYTLSETIEEGAFLLNRKGGREDSGSPHKIPLTTKEKTKGSHQNIQLLTMPEVVEGSIYKLSFTGHDRAGNFTAPISLPGIQYDFTPPEISILSLPDSTDINYLYISYDLSETLNEATITWERTGGAADSKRMHKQSLLDNELFDGVHMKTHILNTPNLNDGAVYSVSIAGKDRAGNESNIPIVQDILYDITAPAIAISHPQSRSYVPTPSISYELSEKLHRGKIAYVQTSGTPDSLAPHEIIMDLSLRLKGAHQNIFKEEGPELMEGAVYTISITGSDRAGNEAVVASIPGIIYDAIPPLLTIQTPDSTTAVNHNRVSFSKSEDLAGGTIKWIRNGGAQDPTAPYHVDLTDSELKKGLTENYTLSNAPRLKDGVIYNILIQANDFAGNESEAMVMAGVLYDISPPVLQIDSPGNNHYTKGTELKFSFSEDLAVGRISWDGSKPDNTIIAASWDLNGQLLKNGTYALNDFFEPELEDGGIYTITFSGKDPAGNIAVPAQINNYTIDRTPPIFSNLLPIDDSFVNQDHVGYLLSENLAYGVMILKTGKEEQSVNLQGRELQSGENPLQKLLAQPRWNDGNDYIIHFIGTDFAGNVSDTVTIKNLHYDISPPVLAVDDPVVNSYINEMFVDISVNEPLLEGQMVWEPKSGTLVMENLLSDHIVQGEHLLDYSLTLEERIPYSIYIQGVDRAGNMGQSIPIENIQYDITKPELVIVAPSPESILNHKRVSYSLGEDLQAGKLVWQDVSGLDEKPVHEIILNTEELTAGDHTDIVLNKIPELFDGASYMLRMEGTDFAGNENDAAPIPKYLFDASPPDFTNLKPESGSLINAVDLTFNISEDLSAGQIIFTRTAGAEDAKSPHIVNLTGSRLKKGERGGLLPEAMVKLINGAIYNINYKGQDFAGNTSAETKVENIAYDDEPPVVFLKTPKSNSYTNSLVLDYLIGENMVNGQIKVKIDKKKEIVIELTESQRNEGEYSQFIPDELKKLKDGIVIDFELSGSDAAGNVSIPYRLENIKYDTTHPKIEIITPQSGATINYSTMSVKISENLAECYLVVTQVGGVLDGRSPQRIPLQNREMKMGEYENIQFSNGPRLQNGSIYTYEFVGKDFVGNEVQSTKISNITYDNEPPVVSLSKPVDAEQIKSTKISYMLSDNLSSGRVIFEHVGGTYDPDSPHTVDLSGLELKQGPQMDIDMKLMENLADGARYKVSIQGWDKAGNESQIAAVNNVLFDVLPPELTIHTPEEGSAFNEPIISFEMNEKLAEGTFTFKQIGGVMDANSPHDILILPPFNDQGRYDEVSLANDVSLQDGSEYKITFNARDPAGNVSSPVFVNNILYDITAPVIETTAPEANSYLREMNVQYILDEQLVMGQINIMQRMGTSDISSPHLIQLKGEQLLLGEHQIDVLEHIELVSGAEYVVQIFGQDRAGNSSVVLEVGQLVFDIEPPDLKIFSPLFETKVNNTIVGFNIGERLLDLSIKWIDKDGTEQLKNLPEKYFLPDKYNQVIVTEPPTLVNGKKYTIKLKGTDMAGNIAETQIDNIEYDITPPVFEMISPKDNSYQNNTNLAFNISEPLKEGRVIWKAVGGKSDPISPKNIELSPNELINGISLPVDLTHQTQLQDGSIYQISIIGIDLAGNSGESLLVNNFHFDTTPPVIQLLSPGNDSYVNHDNANFSINETLKSGKITWKRIEGEIDPNIHVVELKGDMLKKGTHETSGFSDLPLVSMVDYLIEITGVDLAGNTVLVPSSKSFHFDTTPPVLTINKPEENSFINHQNVTFSVSEPLQKGALHFTNQGTGIMKKIALIGEELTILNWENMPLSTPLSIEDGGTFTYELIGIDLAGNEGKSPIVSDIKYDISKPVFTITRPKKNYVNVESITSYTLNEYIVSGTATWVRTGGKILGFVGTANRPQIMELNGNEMLEGDHKNILFTNSPKLNATTIYKLTLQGIDAAGNESLPVSVDGIAFIPEINGNWFFEGAIMTVVWNFEPDQGVDDQSSGKFSQGVQLGTKISNQEFGSYTIDYTKNPWEMKWVMDKSGLQRFSIFEFRDNLHMKVLTKDRRKPKNWTDGEIMFYEKR